MANDVSAEGGVMGGVDNTVHLIGRDGAVETWPRLGKDEVARRLVAHLAALLAGCRRPAGSPPVSEPDSPNGVTRSGAEGRCAQGR